MSNTYATALSKPALPHAHTPGIEFPTFCEGLHRLTEGGVIDDPHGTGVTGKPIRLALPEPSNPDSDQGTFNQRIKGATLSRVIAQGAGGTVLKLTLDRGGVLVSYALKLIVPTSDDPNDPTITKERTANDHLQDFDPDCQYHIPLCAHGLVIPLMAPAPPYLFGLLYPCGETSLTHVMNHDTTTMATLHVYLTQIQAALTFLATHHVSHGDVKSGNVVVFNRQGEKRAILIDYESIRIIKDPPELVPLTATFPPPSHTHQLNKGFVTTLTPDLDRYAHALMVAEACGIPIHTLSFKHMSKKTNQKLTQLIHSLSQEDLTYPLVQWALAFISQEQQKLVLKEASSALGGGHNQSGKS